MAAARGRSSLNPDGSRRCLNLRIDDQTLERATVAAEQLGTSRSALIRASLRRTLVA